MKKIIQLFTAILLLITTANATWFNNDDKPKTATQDNKTYTLRLAETWPSNFPIFGDTTKKFKQLAETMSNGRLKIRIDSKNKHKSALGIFDFVKSGQYDLGHSGSYYWKGKDINTLFFTSMPFGMTANEQHAWFEYGGGQELMDKVYAKHGIKSIIGGNTSNQMGGWFKKEINSIEDLKGLKMRIPGFAGEIMAEVGAKPTNIPAGELYTALDRGTIDALEWVGPSLDLRMGFHKVAPYYYTGWHEPGSELQFLINLKKYNALPKDLQAILITAMKLSAYDMYAHSNDASAKNWATMKKDYPNIKVKTFPKAVFAKLRAANDKLLGELAAKNPLSKEIIESRHNYLQKIRAWTNISDKAYLNSFD
ncbi:TRAP transporter solute receptor, unknown substrate 6 [uncultured Gammaproteobacteria bacterium]|jgi:TRAP-type mannitol/chloroaromatic compound transport system substrate-binding protein|uniref:TRAP dicarboxylate transporter subunit DctP n=3 Tax=sulfur-oxidizing symbionts TaxID=32036 RepID=A0A1H6JFF2_9GAMM|nr:MULTISPECIES: TRAP transporter substrate-binding protein [sulfur-oxidizing symbionts]CAC5824324.1 TRAP transporter solute receptor, unknown substrate 6 [uncultured Gammaproteobacteria bacterium]CAB5502599.1 TRAP transporter solute receptor, unknown substrate 6 [Bathymodiolus azoricus thioautotrophic gill symbiont]CAB5504488.1 TRAP transporter solute receptor, unknown substrate 6 [Bathymodiolus thermophilus thioautotrophic gill symbiont]CAC9512619.1 TRAP transporter solute receptor, unknown s